MLVNVMIGILRAQNNVGLAQQNQNIADSFVRNGRILIYEATTVRDEAGVEEGEAMIAKGEAMKTDTFEHLDNAMNDLNSNVNVVSEQYEETENSDVSSEDGQEISSVNPENADGESEVVVGKLGKGNAGNVGNVKVSFSAAFRHSKLDVRA